MSIGQWFDEGASAQSSGADRGSCPYKDGEARHEWISGFDEAVKFEHDTCLRKAGGPGRQPAEREIRERQQ